MPASTTCAWRRRCCARPLADSCLSHLAESARGPDVDAIEGSRGHARAAAPGPPGERAARLPGFAALRADHAARRELPRDASRSEEDMRPFRQAQLPDSAAGAPLGESRPAGREAPRAEHTRAGGVRLRRGAREMYTPGARDPLETRATVAGGGGFSGETFWLRQAQVRSVPCHAQHFGPP